MCENPYGVTVPGDSRPPVWRSGWLWSVIAIMSAASHSLSRFFFHDVPAMSRPGSISVWTDIVYYLVFRDIEFMIVGVVIAFILRCTRPVHWRIGAATSLWGGISAVYIISYGVGRIPAKGVQDIGAIIFFSTYLICTILMMLAAVRLIRREAHSTFGYDKLVMLSDFVAVVVLSFHGSVWGLLFSVRLIG